MFSFEFILTMKMPLGGWEFSNDDSCDEKDIWSVGKADLWNGVGFYERSIIKGLMRYG